MKETRIIIVGGGFAGVRCAKTLRKRLRRETHEVVLFNHENHMVFHPLLAEVVGASVDPDVTSTPLRQMLPGVHCRTAEVRDVDLAAQEVIAEVDDDRPMRMRYDHLVLASGVGANLSTVPGMADHAFPLKTVGDALALRNHVLEQLEKAELCEDEDRRRWHLSFVVVGGGFSGVEVAGEINDLVRSSRRFFHNIVEDELNVTLVHSRNQILPEVPSSLREFARQQMQRAGIRILLNERVVIATRDGVGLTSERWIRGATVVSTIGTVTRPFVDRLPVQKEGGWLITRPDMRLAQHDNVWAIGDCARVVNGHDGSISPPTGQFAERQGRQVAENIVRVLQGRPTRPFRHKELGELCSIGGRSAVAELFGIRLSGFVAWFLWRGIYLTKLPSWPRRIKVAFDWAWGLVFSRDLAHLKADVTDRVSHACFRAGDFIFRSGDPSTSFYVIERGQVEVLQPAHDEAPEQVIAVLGPGDYFGEMALMEALPHRRSVRARSDAEVVVLGRESFKRISGSLEPLRQAVAGALERRTNIWQNLPMAHAALQDEPLATFIEALPARPVDADTPFMDAVPVFRDTPHGFLLVTDASGGLEGIVTATDLLRFMEVASKLPRHERAGVTLRSIMSKRPVALLRDDSSTVAVATMREHGLTKLPVLDDVANRRPVGYVRLAHVFEVLLDKLRRVVEPNGSESVTRGNRHA